MTEAIPPKAPTKTQILANIAEETELSKKDVAAVLDALALEIEKSLTKGGPGQFAIPGLCKIVLKDVPAKAKTQGSQPCQRRRNLVEPQASQQEADDSTSERPQGNDLVDLSA